MLMEVTFKTELLTQFSKRMAIKKEQKDPRVVSLSQGTWPREVTATFKVQNAAECTRSCIRDITKIIFIREISCARHTIPNIGGH